MRAIIITIVVGIALVKVGHASAQSGTKTPNTRADGF